MSKRPSMKTTKKQIIDWGIRNIDECGYGVDASEMHNRCWRCGYERYTERCHVIPYSLGGEDKPSNYRLFCPDCHLEQPNVNDYNATDEWVRETNVGSYDSFWKIRKIFKSVFDDATWHFGEKLNESTKKWMATKFVEKLLKEGIIPDEKINNCLKGI